MRDLSHWRQLTAGATRGLTQEQIERVAMRALALEVQNPGGADPNLPYGVWHAAAKTLGTKCHCRRCNPD